MMGKKTSYIKLMKDENPEMLHGVIHRENLVARNISPVLYEAPKSVTDCSNAIKSNAKCKPLLKLFYEEQNADHVRLLIHNEVRWLSKWNCLKSIMKLFDTLSDFLIDKPEMKYLLTVNGKAFMSYLAISFKN
ncbi:hypothetical protein AVEN_189898-1 [Araneus ventricosus]|uniref:SCAN domain-containing protein 3 n=1 Tax=Araneus ventricosus TaxID=182803 RepID=A0A4Y2LYI9_ARAVE|nr:hypothetical protein AVEN_189898-1 [Araneus ventricosus]